MITQVGPDVQLTAGSDGAVTVPVAGAARYTTGVAQVAPSQDAATPGPVAADAAPLPVPPPTAMQKVSEMQETELNPPAGGSTVRTLLQPGTGTTGVGTVVGTADRPDAVIEEAAGSDAVVEEETGWDTGRRAAAGAEVEQPQPVEASAATEMTAAHRLAVTDPLCPRRRVSDQRE